MTDPAATSVLPPREDPRDRRRRRTALACATLSSGALGMVIGALTHSWDRVYESGVFWVAAISVASLAGLWALITSSTKDAVGQLIELIISRIVAITEDAKTWIAGMVQDALREVVKEQLAEPGHSIAGDLSRIKDRVYMRKDDDPRAAGDHPTVPIKYEIPPVARQVVYAAAAPVAGAGGDSRLEERLAAIEERFEEFGNQRWFAGYAAATEDGGNGRVVPMAQRNGSRTT